MAVKIRLARGGAKKLPYYRIVVADSRSPRDGSFIEKVGTYNPLLKKAGNQRVIFKKNRIEYWLSQGAQPTERVITFIQSAGIELPLSIARKVVTKLKNRVKRIPKKK